MWPCEEKWSITSLSLCLQQVNPLNPSGYFMYHDVSHSQTARSAENVLQWLSRVANVGRHLTVKCIQETGLISRPSASRLSAWLSTTCCYKQYGCVCSISGEQLTAAVSSLWLHDYQGHSWGMQVPAVNMAETTDVFTTVSVSNPHSLCCCDTFCLTNKRTCKCERKFGTAFAASLSIHNMKGCTSSRTAWLFVSDGRQCSLVCLSNADTMCFCEVEKWLLKFQLEVKKMRWAGKLARMEDREVHRGFWWVSLREWNCYFEDLGVVGRIILKWISKKKDGDRDWIDLAQGRDKCQAFVNAVMNFRVL